ncbi:MAG: hypothetical protein IPM95_04060 [Sphingobacteriales bacterium]|nr:hypothetical protein [Sphingobacteriales bacterium]
MRYYPLIIACLIFCICACDEDSRLVEVYVSGYRFDTTGSESIDGVFYKNLISTTIASPTAPLRNFFANDIMLDGDDIYILGTLSPLSSDSKKTVYWKNGTVNYLDRGAGNSEATDLFVESRNVYVLVHDNLNAMNNLGYYTNGRYVPVTSTQGTGNYGAEMFVRNGNIYIAGYEYYPDSDSTIPRYWVNNTIVDLAVPAIWSGLARSVYVTEADISYVAGSVIMDESYLVSIPVYWINGVFTALPLSTGFVGGQANSVFVESGNVYIGGMQYDAGYNCKVTYWKNGTPVMIDSGVYGYSSVLKIAAKNDNVYCIGFRDERNSAALWINGSRVNLGRAGSYTYLSGLYIK